MTAPTFVSDAFFYSDTGAVTDNANVIPLIRTALVTNLGWTEPSAGRFKTPVDAVGRFFDVLVTAISASRLGWRVRDQNGVDLFGAGVTREIQIDTLGTSVRVYASAHSILLEYQRQDGTWEHCYAGMLDESPEAQNSHTIYTIANATRPSGGGGADGNFGTCGIYFMLDNGVAAAASRVRGWYYRVDGTSYPLFMASGALVFFPVEVSANAAGSNRWMGRLFQAYVGDSSLAFGTEKSIPIDSSPVTLGTFRVVGLATVGNQRLLFRKA